jgi:hypothetical protein
MIDRELAVNNIHNAPRPNHRILEAATTRGDKGISPSTIVFESGQRRAGKLHAPSSLR